MDRTEHTYNATAAYTDPEGEVYCLAVVQVGKARDGSIKVFRSNGLWTSNNGTEEYHNDWLRAAKGNLRIGGKGSTCRLVLDNKAMFKAGFGRKMAGMKIDEDKVVAVYA